MNINCIKGGEGMSLQFYESLVSMNDKEVIEKFLIFNGSLVIAGAKPSATITLKKNKDNIYDKWIKYGEQFLKSIGLEYIDLRETESALIILVYNDNKLREVLHNDTNREFLNKMGYIESDDCKEYLAHLNMRYQQYKCPHELGIFLGFPIDDVIDFMECTSKKCLACGYWLVYNDLDKSNEIFKKYDRIKSHTISYLLQKNSSYKIAKDIMSLT